jgi:hypothetical protein
VPKVVLHYSGTTASCFLHELPDFNRRSLEVLRQPLEEGGVTVSRALFWSTFPARFILATGRTPDSKGGGLRFPPLRKRRYGELARCPAD